MFLRRKLDACAVNKTTKRGRGEVKFIEVVDRVSVVVTD